MPDVFTVFLNKDDDDDRPPARRGLAFPWSSAAPEERGC